MLTLEEFVKLSEPERGERFCELSSEDRFFVRLHDYKGATIPTKKLSSKEMLAAIEEDEKLLGIDLTDIKNNLRKDIENGL